MTRQPTVDVVVIDDNIEALASMTTIIAMHGFTTEAFHSGTSAIEAIRQLRPRLILSDLELDGISGYDVLEATLAIDPAYQPVTVSMTAWDNADIRFRRGRGKFDYDLKKPLTLQVILSVLDLLGSSHTDSQD